MTSPQAPIALVTGGSRGIGRATALLLADRGFDLVITYRDNQAAAAEVVAAIEQRGRRATALPLEIAAPATFAAFAGAVRGVLERWSAPRIHALVNNAGVGHYALIADQTEAQFQALFDVHLKGPYFLTQALLPVVADHGRIVNVSTGLARYTYPGTSAYAIMKGGLEVFTRSAARELGARGITVNTVAPGGVVTDFGGGVMRDPGLQSSVIEQTPLGRVGVPEDVAGAIAMLLAPESGWVTGQRIEATGGYAL